MTQDIHRDRLLILDFGSQYTQLIARRIREVGVYCEIIPWDSSSDDIAAFGPSGVILSGGPESVTASDSPRAPDLVFTLDVPILGICYGMQTMAAQLGGAVEGSDTSEFGYAQIRRTTADGLFNDLSDGEDPEGHQLLDVWMSHGDKVCQLPPDFECIASTDSCPIAGMAHATSLGSVFSFILKSRIPCRVKRSSVTLFSPFVAATHSGRRPILLKTP